MSPQYGELQPMAETGSGIWGTPANFNGFRIFALLLQSAATSLTGGQPNFARCLAVSWAGTLYIQLVSWSLTSLFSTNTAISERKGQGWRVILTQ